MNPYLIARKIVQTISLVLLMAVVLYVIFRLMPGNPAQLFLVSARHVGNAQELQSLEIELGLQGGKWNFHNFLVYMYDILTFNFGYDYYREATVWFLIEQALPYTLALLGTATVLSYVLGLPLGVITTWFRGKTTEGALVTSGLVLSSIPYFILAIILFLYFVVKLHIAPVTGEFPVGDLTTVGWGNFVTVTTDLALPLATLLVIGAASNLLTMRAAMVSVLGQDFIVTARAKGASEGSIMFHHAARNAMIPVSTQMALNFALIVSGAIITEIIFSIPGLGLLTYNAILDLDYPLAEGAFFVISLVTIFAYAGIDFIHAWLDPRIQI
ncbi:MAG: ABC transporter permease [Thermoplasmata archaeon]|nr:ABC transporter permease [Thermoplasmata archaeon]